MLKLRRDKWDKIVSIQIWVLPSNACLLANRESKTMHYNYRLEKNHCHPWGDDILNIEIVSLQRKDPSLLSTVARNPSSGKRSLMPKGITFKILQRPSTLYGEWLHNAKSLLPPPSWITYLSWFGSNCARHQKGFLHCSGTFFLLSSQGF